MSTCRPVNLSTRLTGPGVNIGSVWLYGYSVLVDLSTCDLSTCLPGLTDQEVNIGMQGIMGISLHNAPVDLTGPDVNILYPGIVLCLLHRVHIHLSTCQPICQGIQV